MEGTDRPPWSKDFDRYEDSDSDLDAAVSSGQERESTSSSRERRTGRKKKEPDVVDWKKTPNLMRNPSDFATGKKKVKGRGKNQDLNEEGNGMKQQNMGLHLSPEEFRKVYLFLYNLFSFVGYIYVLVILCIRFTRGLEDIERELQLHDAAAAYKILGSVLRFLALLKVLDVIHPMLGYTTGDVLYPCIQSGLRLILLVIIIDCEPRITIRPVTFNLFCIWSITDAIRYCYYMLRVFEVESYLTWIQYTMWMILYPVGYMCEVVVMLVAIPFLEETGRFSLSLPNPWNVSFHLPMILRCYVLFLSFPVFSMQITRMYKKRKYRCRSLGSINKVKFQ